MTNNNSSNENERLAALYRYNILDTPAEEAFDRITNIARTALDKPFALISLIDRHRQWFKSRHGTKLSEMPRDIAFCNYTIQSEGILQVSNLRKDDRFAKNPYVAGFPYLRFYCGIPLCTKDNFNIGSLCVLGYRSHVLTKDQVSILTDLARLTMDEIELRNIADIDYLTGLSARPAFFREGDMQLVRQKGDSSTSSLVIFEVDHFKKIYEKYGHKAGDKVLQSVADLCRPLVKEGDVFARLGGEEFGIFMRNASAIEANKLADKIILTIEGMEVPYIDTRIKTSCGVGIATSMANESFKAMYSRAEIALYKARNKPGNHDPKYIPTGETRADYSYESVPALVSEAN